MLQNIRDRSQSWVSILIIGFLIVMFALWGISYYLGGGALSAQSVAKVNGQSLNINQFRETYGQLRRRDAAQIDSGSTTIAKVKEQALQSLISQEVLYQSAKTAGLGLGSKALDQYISQMPSFKQDGHFSQALLTAYLRNQGLSIDGLRQKLAKSIAINQWRIGLMSSGFVTPSELNEYAKLSAQKRKIRSAIIHAKNYQGDVKISANEVAAYYKAHSKDFTAPRQVQLAYLSLTLGDIAKTISVTEDDAKAYYQENLSAFSSPPQRKAAMILISAPKTALASVQQLEKKQVDKIEAQLKAGASFAALAKKYSADPVSAQKGGDLGWLTLDAKPLNKTLFQLKAVGDVSAPIRTNYGWQIVKYVAYKPGKQQPFSAVKLQVTTRLKRAEAEKKYASVGNEMNNLTFQDPTSLKPAANKLNLKIQTTGWITEKGDKQSGLAANAKVRKVAFSDEVLGQGDNSDPININNEHVVIVRVTKHEPAKLKPLSDVKTQITKLLTKQQAMAKAKNAANELLVGLSKNPLAANTAFTEQTVSRQDKTGNIAIVKAAFGLNVPTKNHPLSAKLQKIDGVGYAVVQLQSVEAGRQPSSQELSALKAFLSQLSGVMSYMQYQQFAQAQAKIIRKVNVSDL